MRSRCGARQRSRHGQNSRNGSDCRGGAWWGKVVYRVLKANPPVRDRVSLVNARLRNARDEVRLFVDPKCRELIEDFEQVSYQEDSTQIDKDRDGKRTHLSDALGYLIWQEDRNGTIGERGERLF